MIYEGIHWFMKVYAMIYEGIRYDLWRYTLWFMKEYAIIWFWPDQGCLGAYIWWNRLSLTTHSIPDILLNDQYFGSSAWQSLVLSGMFQKGSTPVKDTFCHNIVVSVSDANMVESIPGLNARHCEGWPSYTDGDGKPKDWLRSAIVFVQLSRFYWGDPKPHYSNLSN